VRVVLEGGHAVQLLQKTRANVGVRSTPHVCSNAVIMSFSI